MNRERHAMLIDLASVAKDNFESESVKIMFSQQEEIDGLKRLLIDILKKEYPEDIIKYADYLDVD